MAYAKICFVKINKATGKIKGKPKVAPVGFSATMVWLSCFGLSCLVPLWREDKETSSALFFTPLFAFIFGAIAIANPPSGIISGIVTVILYIISAFFLGIYIVYAFCYNAIYIKSLIKDGYVVVATTAVEDVAHAEISYLNKKLNLTLPLSASFKEANAIYRKKGWKGWREWNEWLANHKESPQGRSEKHDYTHQQSGKSYESNRTRDEKREDDRQQSPKPKAKSEYDYYAILGIEKTADLTAIKSAYREMAKRYHPDTVKNNKWAEARFKEIQEAYEVLKDSKKRADYDRSLG